MRVIEPLQAGTSRFEQPRFARQKAMGVPSASPVPADRAQPVSAALCQAYVGVNPLFGQTARHVRSVRTLVPGHLPRFGQGIATPAKGFQQYQSYPITRPDGSQGTLRFAPGDPACLGATWVNPSARTQSGVNFAFFSKHATQVDLCLFNAENDTREVARIPLQRSGDIWHGFSPDLKPGQLYGFRVSGPYDPAQGHRFNEHKLLLDPYAKAVARPITQWDDSQLGFEAKNPYDPARKSTQDSAATVNLGVVMDNDFDWKGDRRPDVPWQNTLIYEAHVKGMTALHPLVPKHLRGTYAGMAHPAVIKHLKELGVTAVELLPVHYSPDNHTAQGLSNYWGYNTLGFFAPQPEYAANRKTPDGPVREFKEMVRTYHQNGLEVLLDVVYNHTAEGNEMGPTLSLRGADNRSYYRLVNGQKQYYMDYTGTGNTLDATNPTVIKLIVDSLRYWVEEMHVDGFRFDLMSALARAPHGQMYSDISYHPLFKAIQSDPVLSKVKLIAEPWDISMEGYKVGAYPNGWREWNGRYRDDVRKFWKGEPGMLDDFTTRLAGNSDYYPQRGPLASINFVTAHDGFTMRDLVSYERKNNWANRENNRDGENNNHSSNFGVEGDTTDPAVLARRQRQIKNFWATLLFSQGVPMVLHGDELGRTQGGNNNAYCQDNPTSWIDWGKADAEILAFAKKVSNLRKQHPVFRRTQFFSEKQFQPGRKDVTWFRADGQPMRDSDWMLTYAQSVGVMYDGDAPGLAGKDNHFLLLVNASNISLPFTLPAHAEGQSWRLELDTAEPVNTPRAGQAYAAGSVYTMAPGSLVLLKMPNP